MNLTTEQHKRILDNLFFYNRPINDIAIGLLGNKHNDINDKDAIIKKLLKIKEENIHKYRPRKPQQRMNHDKVKLSWIDKDEELLTEEDLFTMPLPEAWKLPYMK